MNEQLGSISLESDHYFLRLIAQRKPETMSIHIDDAEVFKARFTEQGLETIFDLLIDPNKPRRMLTISLDNDIEPVYSLNLGGTTG